jgi:hypothetical protein
MGHMEREENMAVIHYKTNRTYTYHIIMKRTSSKSREGGYIKHFQ